ncbi:TatD family hydrolase [Streptomyces caniscabiei]|uniref:TatD family hydrolase n=1 Tax=Streptomyces caniscabiei TaxID=2746961 RepID=UPI0029B7BDF2|nr:TatD family hydrolase [Streptomyces caniscabiei]MDX2776685.1 TatD family hydrolase [Streptomyces caniscabiei]
MLIDTHCHIHEADYPLDAEEVLSRASAERVKKLICVGTSEESSREAVEFAALHNGVFASVGVHPHEAKDGYGEVERLLGLERTKIVAVGEIGLDYFYTHSPRETQIKALEAQIDAALRHDLPIIFHVREAFDDFWPIFDNFHSIRGELHSFTDSTKNMEEGLKRGLFIGVNGISTFTKDAAQQQMFGAVPLDKMLLETDAPFLTPTPLRGKVNEPAFVTHVAAFHAEKRGISPGELAAVTTANAERLFVI